MHKKLLVIIFILFFGIFMTACHRPKSAILFNENPITKDNILNNATQFKIHKRIYYVFMTEKQLDSGFVRMRIVKRDEKAQMNSTDVVYSNDFKLKQGEAYYFTDYIVMNEAGYYQMVIYSTNALNKPLAVADFQVLDN